MAPNVNRWKDITLNPCNRTAERRNTAAIRDALQALAEQEPETGEPGESVTDVHIFFEVASDNVDGTSVSVTELEYNSGTSQWEATGSTYTAYDWSGRNMFGHSFRSGFLGIGRLNTAVALDALEVIAIEGYARMVEVTLAEDMGETTTNQALCDVVEYWGDTANGHDPGSQVTLHDVTNMAPQAVENDVALGLYDEKNQRYVFIAPWKGSQAQGEAAIIQLDGGACGESTVEGEKCLYSGKLKVGNTDGTSFCTTDDLDDGAPVWVIDARSCNKNSRLGTKERYIGVSLGFDFDFSEDERAVYGIVDYAPPIRWFRIMSDPETITFTTPEINSMTCRTHDCGGDQDDDAPSVWGVWSDIDPCSREEEVIDDTPTLIYFPRYRGLCDGEVSDAEEICRAGAAADRNCRQNEVIPAWWNPVAERWEALADAESCVQRTDVSLVEFCDDVADLTCCLFPGKKVSFYPRDSSYCDPTREVEDIWLLCNSRQVEYVRGDCGFGIRICESFTCNGLTMPVYLYKCADCTVCLCPEHRIDYELSVGNVLGPCGFIDGITGHMECVERNPFDFDELEAPQPYWYTEFNIAGLMPRMLYTYELDQDEAIGGLEFVDVEYLFTCSGSGATASIIGVYEHGSGGETVSAFSKEELASHVIDGPLVCATIVDGDDNVQYRARTWTYAMVGKCTDNGGLNTMQLYLISCAATHRTMNKCDSGTVQTVDEESILSGAETIDLFQECCAYQQRGYLTDYKLSCSADVLIDLEWGGTMHECSQHSEFIESDEGDTEHVIGGCPCNYVASDCLEQAPGFPCVGLFPTLDNPICCGEEGNRVYINLWWNEPNLV